ncbi:unnamed protein product [Brassica rapa subsp. trilocularis]
MSQSGRVVGDYLVGRHMNIGTGSFSVLWEAKHSLFTGLMWLSRRYLWPGLTRSFRTVSCLRFLSSEDQSSQLHPFARRGRGYTSKVKNSILSASTQCFFAVTLFLSVSELSFD